MTTTLLVHNFELWDVTSTTTAGFETIAGVYFDRLQVFLGVSWR